MLYGAVIAETITLNVAGAVQPLTITVPGTRRPPLNQRLMIDKLKKVNELSHETIRFPQNFEDLPDVLSHRVWALILERKRNDEAKRRKHYKNLPAKYQRMADAAAEAVGEIQPTYLAYYRCLVPVLAQHQIGNCGEYAALVVNELLGSVEEQRIRLLKGGLGHGNNHVCVVLDASRDAKPADGRSYGDRAVVCDAWLDFVAVPAEYFRVLNVIKCEFRPVALKGLADQAD